MAVKLFAGAAPETTLASDITASSTSLTGIDLTGYPSPSGSQVSNLVIDPGLVNEEKVTYGSRTSNTANSLLRGRDGTAAAAHTAGAKIRHVMFAEDIQNADDLVNGLVIPMTHTWAIAGTIAVPSGDTDFIIPMAVMVPSGWTAVLSRIRYKINGGTSVTFKMQKGGSDMTGFTSLSATTTAATTDPADVSLADLDQIVPVVTAVAGTPKNLFISADVRLTYAG